MEDGALRAYVKAASAKLAQQAVRDIGDALVVLAQSQRMREPPLGIIAEALREAIKRRYLFVIRKKDIPIAVVVVYRRKIDQEGNLVQPALLTLSDWDSGSELAILDLYSVRGDDDPVLCGKAAAILAKFRENLARRRDGNA